MKKHLFVILTFLFCLLILASCNKIANTDPDPAPQDTDSCNVDFDLNGGYQSLPAVQYLHKGDFAAKPADPIRPGYTFEGWFQNKNGSGEAWDFSTDTLTTGILLYAKWEIVLYTICFDLDGGMGVTPINQTISYIQKPNAPTEIITKDGYVFCGWWLKNESGDYIQEWNFSSDLPSADITLYAGWGTANQNADYAYIELDSAVKLLGYINAFVPEEELVLPFEINGKPVLSIAAQAFDYFDDTYRIVLPASLTTIGEKAFMGSSAVSNLTIPNSVTSIGKMAFDSCPNLYNLILGTGVLNIGEMAFYQCTDLMSNSSDKLVIPSNVRTIEKDAFSISCVDGALYNVEFHNGLISIGDSAFKYAYLLRLDLPDSVEKIGDFAFQYNKYLTRIEIGKNILTVGQRAFESCNSSLYVILRAKTPPVLGSIDVFGVFTVNNGTPSRPNFFITVPAASLNAYQTAVNWNVYYNSRIVNVQFDEIIYPVR